MLRIEVVCADRDQLGEGPLWDVEESRLYWIDSYGPAIHVMDAKGGGKRSWRVPEPIGSLALRRGDPPVVTRVQKGLVVFDLRTITADHLPVLLDAVRKVCHDRNSQSESVGPPNC